ncbi:hypothetical protein Zm00014a_020682 [Zea mays]|uniref:Uncharacterized protein n=1 Tax=Zea mays TaxID=4577 RepID=A0A3L6G2F5_MAIZE|nr:hypothetical protein Zm00014a_020682 [Zea mays]
MDKLINKNALHSC